jgi:hypothetical protein
MSAFAIGLSGLATVLFGQTFPAFTNISHSHTDFIQVTSTFLEEEMLGQLACASDSGKQSNISKRSRSL